jgi:hypothetical protein
MRIFQMPVIDRPIYWHLYPRLPMAGAAALAGRKTGRPLDGCTVFGLLGFPLF